MTRTDTSSERTNQILDAAATIFARQGFQQARIDDIAREAGVSKGTIYWYFESKERIIEALMHRLFDPELARARSLIDDDRPAIDRLLEFTEHSATLAQQIVDSGLLSLFFEYYALANRNEDARVFLRDFTEVGNNLVLPLFEQGIARGELRAHDPYVMTKTYNALVDGLVMGVGLEPGPVSLKEHILAAVHVLLAGLRAD